MATLNNLPKVVDACSVGARYFNSFETPHGFVEKCNRGDWLLWLFEQTNPNHHRLRILAAGRVASIARHLMQDQRSIDAVDMAIAYGNGTKDKESLDNLRELARIAEGDDELTEHWERLAAQAAYYATKGSYTSAVRAVNALAFYADHENYAKAKAAAQQATADIFRRAVPIEIWDFN